MSSADPAVEIHLTGFGRFGQNNTNPTEYLAKYFQVHPLIASSTVIEVSIEGVQTALPRVLNHCSKSPNKRKVLIHMGLNGYAQTINLESCAYNEAKFEIPDERGNMPNRVPVEEGQPAQRTTALDCEQLATLMRERGPWPVAVSTDPGRYICNYTYFSSLCWCSKPDNNSVSLFVHVPPFDVLPEEDQRSFFEALFQVLSSLTSEEHNSNGSSQHLLNATPTPEEEDALQKLDRVWQQKVEEKAKSEKSLVEEKKLKAEEDLDHFYNARTDALAARQAANRECQTTEAEQQNSVNNPWEKVWKTIDSKQESPDRARMKNLLRGLAYDQPSKAQ